MTELEHTSEPKDGTTHRLVLTNEQTGKIELELTSIAGGIYVVHQTTDTELGTRQGAFGDQGGIILSSMKAPSVLRDLLTRIGVLEATRSVAKSCGLSLTL